MIKADDLLKIPGSEKINPGRIDLKRKLFKSVGIDSRIISKDSIFFAIKGEENDGHKFIEDVFRKGVKLAVINETWYKRNKSKFPEEKLFAVKDTTAALGQFAKIHKDNFRIPVLCIGGSNGKTTTKDLVAEVLSAKFKVLKTEGNFNNHIGLPLTLLRMNKEHEFCVLEAGCNHFGEIEYLCGIAEPDYGLITNIGKEHLEFFKDKKGVAKAEFELFDYLKKKKDTKIFINSDDNFIKNYSGEIKNEKKFTYSYSHNSDVKGRFKGYNKNFEPEIGIAYREEKFEVSISTFGKHSIFNGLAAASVGLYFKIGKSSIKKALKKFKPSSSKRMEVLKTNGMVIINDTYNSNPESVRMGLETLIEYKTTGNKYAVLSDMLELGAVSGKEHSEIGKYSEKIKINNLYTFGKESYKTFLNAKKIKNNFYFEDKNDLIKMLQLNLKKGDIIYVKGSRGMKMEEVVQAISGKMN